MTPEERAEKMADLFAMHPVMRREMMERFAAEIRSAVEEGISNTLGTNVIHSQAWLTQELSRAKAEAYEEAAKIADDEYGCDALAERIRARAQSLQEKLK